MDVEVAHKVLIKEPLYCCGMYNYDVRLCMR